MSEYLKFTSSLEGPGLKRGTRPETRYKDMDQYEQKPFIMEKYDSPISGFASKFLPVQRITVNLEDGVAIAPGVIVSAYQIYKESLYLGGSTDSVSGIAANGSIVVGYDKDNASMSVPADNRMDAYGENQQIVLTVANGGTDTLLKYSDKDVTLGVLDMDGNGPVVAGETFANPKNLPVGVTPAKVMADYRNRWLNSNGNVEEGDSIRVKGVIAVPFFINDEMKFGEVTVDAVGTDDAIGTPLNEAEDSAGTEGYNAMLPWTGFLYAGARTKKDNVRDQFINGEYLVSDPNGRFIPLSATTADALTASKTAQVVGRLLQLDTKPYKDWKEFDKTYPGSGITGTETYGIDSYMFNLVREALIASGADSADSDVKAQFDNGKVGVAHILLHVL